MRNLERFQNTLFTTALILTAGLLMAGFAFQSGLDSHSTNVTDKPDFRWSGHIDKDDYLEIHNINGDVRVVQATGDKVMVTAQKYSEEDNPESVHIKVVRHENGVTICSVYPENSWWGDSQKCAPGNEADLKTSDSDVEVDYVVHLPTDVYVIGRTVNGDINMESIAGNATAVTVNGDIRASTSGYVEAKTVNGSIVAVVGSTDWQETLDISTVNGSITVKLPNEASTRVEAETVSGDISTNFESLDIEEGWVGSELEGIIGTGGRSLSLETVNGDIHIAKK